MRQLAILAPYTPAAIGGTVGNASRAGGNDPREATAGAASTATRTIDIDLGSVKPIDTAFLGYVTSSAYQDVTPTYGTAGYTEAFLPTMSLPPDEGLGYRHYAVRVDTPVQARYIRFPVALGVGGTIGIVAVGDAVAPQWGHEWGSGRFVTDNGSSERLSGGGFGIDEGAVTGGYEWTFGDLTDDETAALYALQRARGSSRVVFVWEDPDDATSLSRHWGLMRKLETYERLSPGLTKWGMRVEDWL